MDSLRALAFILVDRKDSCLLGSQAKNNLGEGKDATQVDPSRVSLNSLVQTVSKHFLQRTNANICSFSGLMPMLLLVSATIVTQKQLQAVYDCGCVCVPVKLHVQKQVMGWV